MGTERRLQYVILFCISLYANGHSEVVNNKAIIIDHETGLVWQDDAEVKITQKKWKNAIKYCKDLKLSGYSDWRLPTKTEFLTIIDYGRYNPAIKKKFKNVNSKIYWTNSEYKSDVSHAWFVELFYGYEYYYYKTSAYSVRCVRGNM